jgi:hypothetical protein
MTLNSIIQIVKELFAIRQLLTMKWMYNRLCLGVAVVKFLFNPFLLLIRTCVLREKRV